MAGTFVCPDCECRIYDPEWDGGKPPICQHHDRIPAPDLYETEMVVVD
jgi:hypothetical protein